MNEWLKFIHLISYSKIWWPTKIFTTTYVTKNFLESFLNRQFIHQLGKKRPDHALHALILHFWEEIKELCCDSLQMVFSGIKRVNMAFMKKVQNSMTKFREILEGFIPKSEKFKHQLGHISYFFRQLVGGKNFCSAQILLSSCNKDTWLS